MSYQTRGTSVHKEIDFVKLNSLPAFVTYEQAADALAISYDKIRRLVAKGKLKTTGATKGKRITKDSLCTFATPKSKAVLRIDRELQQIQAGSKPEAEPVLTPEQQNAQFIEEEARKPVIWVGDVGFQGVDEYGRTADARAADYREDLRARAGARITALQVRGV